jgi:hypothetical protein
MRPLFEIADEARRDWQSQRKDSKVPVYADVYLRPMQTLNSINDMYHLDSAETVVRYFLANASTWKGEVARRIKEELNDMLEGKYRDR